MAGTPAEEVGLGRLGVEGSLDGRSLRFVVVLEESVADGEPGVD